MLIENDDNYVCGMDDCTIKWTDCSVKFVNYGRNYSTSVDMGIFLRFEAKWFRSISLLATRVTFEDNIAINDYTFVLSTA